MTDHCPSCPFKGCPDCRYQGGTHDPSSLINHEGRPVDAAARVLYELRHPPDDELASSTTDPLPTVTTVDRHALITGSARLDPDTIDALVDDATFRMLTPEEVAAAMAFPADYIWSGTRRDKVRLAGNAVTPPAARDLLWAVTESLSAA